MGDTGAQSRLWHVGLIVLVSVLVFANTLDNGFFQDDVYRVTENPEIQTFWPPWRHFLDPTTSSSLPRIVQYRPTLPLTLSAQYALVGHHSAAAYHVGNLLLQILAGVLAYALFRELLAHWSRREYSPHVAFFAALAFSLHPVSGVLVNYVCSRDVLLMQVFLLSSFLAYVRMRRLGVTTLRWLACFGCFVLSLVSKKNAVALPGVILLFEFTLGGARLTERRAWVRALPFVLAVTLVLGFIRFGLGFSDFQNVVTGTDRLQYAIEQLQHHTFHYLRNFVWPWPIRQGPVDEIATWKVALGAVVILVSWGLAWRWWRRAPLLAFCILGYQALIVLTSSVLPLFDTIVAYRPYPASALLFLGAAALLFHRGVTRPRVVAAVGVLAWFAISSVGLNRTWKDGEALWGHAVAYGANARAHYNYAMSLPDDRADKRRRFEEALELSPDYTLAHIGLGLFDIRRGRAEDGEARLRRAAANDPRAQSLHWLARGLDAVHKTGEAATIAALASEKLPRNPAYRAFSLHMSAKVLLAQDRVIEAADASREAVRLAPDDVFFRYQAAECAFRAKRFDELVPLLEPVWQRYASYEHTTFYMACGKQMEGKHAEALALFEQYLRDHPDSDTAWFNIGSIHMKERRWQQAADAFLTCLAKNPRQREAHKNLAECFRELGDPAQAKHHQDLYDGN